VGDLHEGFESGHEGTNLREVSGRYELSVKLDTGGVVALLASF